MQLTAIAGFFGGVDVGDEDAVGAHVERLLDAGAVVVSADADEGFCAAVGDAAEHGGKFFVAHGAVLAVDQEPVVAAVGELLGDRGAVGVEEQAHLGLSGAELLFEFGSGECGVGHCDLLKSNCVVYRMGREAANAGEFFGCDRGTGTADSSVAVAFCTGAIRMTSVL